MSRTRMGVRVAHVPLEVVRHTVLEWLEAKDFFIFSPDLGDGMHDFGYHWGRVMLHPRPGRIVCIHYRLLGAFAFELDIRPEGDGVLVDCEGYAAGANLWAGHEWDLDPDTLLIGRWPRRKGHVMMMELEVELRTLSS